MFIHVKVSFALATLALTFAAAQMDVASAATPEEDLLNAVKNDRYQKLGPWFSNLYEEYSASRTKQNFQTRNPILKVHGGEGGGGGVRE